jgi:hypothetical protein
MKNARRNRANWLNTLTASLRRETLRQELSTGVVVSATSSSFEMDEYRACTSILIPTIQARMRRGFDGVRSVAAKVEPAAYARSERSMALRSGSHPVITSKSKAIRYPWRYVAHARPPISIPRSQDVINSYREETADGLYRVRFRGVDDVGRTEPSGLVECFAWMSMAMILDAPAIRAH